LETYEVQDYIKAQRHILKMHRAAFWHEGTVEK